MPTPDELILALLCAQPQHGYAVAEAFADPERLGLIWDMSVSQVYKVLKRLEQAGLLDGTDIPVAAAPNRTEYRITAAGRDVLNKWLDEPNPSPSIRHVRVVFLSRMYAAHALQRPIAGIVQRQIQQCEQQRAVVAAEYEAAQTDPARWALGLHLHQIDAVLAWLSRLYAGHPVS